MTQQNTTEKPKAIRVSITGPELTRHPKTDAEIHVWPVNVLGKALEPIKRYVCYSFEKAARVASEISIDRGIELVDETLPF